MGIAKTLDSKRRHIKENLKAILINAQFTNPQKRKFKNKLYRWPEKEMSAMKGRGRGEGSHAQAQYKACWGKFITPKRLEWSIRGKRYEC